MCRHNLRAASALTRNIAEERWIQLLRFLLNRLLLGVIAIIGIVLVVFIVVRQLGDPAVLMLSPDAPAEAIEAFRIANGLDKSTVVQLWHFVADVAKGDLGRSLRHDEPVLRLIMERIPATLQLTVSALLLSVVIAVPLGVIAARNRGTVKDRVTMGLAVLGQSVPDFWLGLMLMLVAGVWLRILPISGTGTWQHLVLPTITLGVFPLARTTRLVRSGLLEVLGEDYVRTARSKGLREQVIVYKHGLRNALIPVITIIGLEVGSLLGGAVIIETVFAWPGMGRLLVQALNNRDFPLIQAGVLVLAILKVIVNLAVDVLYSSLDPRIRYQ